MKISGKWCRDRAGKVLPRSLGTPQAVVSEQVTSQTDVC